MMITKKVALLVYISENVADKLRELIALKYRRFQKGLLSWEVEQALSHWIALHTKAQRGLIAKAPNPTPNAVRVFYEIKHYLLSKYYEELPAGSTVLDKHLREAIMAVRGSDPRTVKKWLKTLSKFHLIKHLGGALWEIAA